MFLFSLLPTVAPHIEWHAYESINDRKSYYGPFLNLTEEKCNFYKDGLFVNLSPNINTASNHIITKASKIFG